MSNRELTIAAALLLGSLSIAAIPAPAAFLTPAPGPDQLLKEREHKKVGSKIQDWIEAKVENKGVSEASEDLWGEVEKWAKKKEVGGADPLALTGDLGAALWHANGYGTKGIAKGKVKTEEKDEDRTGPLPHTVHAPAKYSPKTAYPLVMIIPDAGKKPFDELTTDWVLKEFRDNAIMVVVHMPENVDAWSEIRDSDGKLGGVANVLRTFGHISKKFAIDFDKVFLVGRGMDGVQTAMVAANMFPDRFAGIIGRTGDVKEVAIDNFRNLPTFFAGGGDGATKFQEAIDAAGYKNCTINPAAKEEDIWAWIQTTERDGSPDEVVLLPGTPFPNRAYWLEVPPWDGTGVAHVKGTVNREENKITIEGTGVVSVIIAFNDELVDMDKKVTVVCNGVENVEIVPRSKEQALTYIFNTRNDPGKFYTARRSFGLPSLNAGAEEEEEAVSEDGGK